MIKGITPERFVLVLELKSKVCLNTNTNIYPISEFITHSGAIRGAPQNIFVLGAPTGIGVPRVKGPRKVVPTRDTFYRQFLHDIQARPQGTPQTRSPYGTRGSYRRFVIPTEKGTPTNRRTLHDIKQGASTRKGLHTSKGA